MRSHPVIQLARPHHWVKNAVVLAPLLFAGLLTDPPSLHRALMALAAFCLLASGIYVFNDLRDAPLDRLHPVKRQRPLASGVISPWAGAAMSAALLAGGLAIAHQLELSAPPLLEHGLASIGPLRWCLAYVVLNAAYTFGLKRVPLVDLICLATGLVLRAVVGATALQLQPSHWLLACCFCLALFLAAGKRRLELTRLGEVAKQTRPLLLSYARRWLDGALLTTSIMAVGCYVLYTLAPDTRAKVDGYGLTLTVPFVGFAIMRAARGILAGTADDPVDILMRDRLILSAALLWTATALAVVYRPW